MAAEYLEHYDEEYSTHSQGATRTGPTASFACHYEHTELPMIYLPPCFLSLLSLFSTNFQSLCAIFEREGWCDCIVPFQGGYLVQVQSAAAEMACLCVGDAYGCCGEDHTLLIHQSQ